MKQQGEYVKWLDTICRIVLVVKWSAVRSGYVRKSECLILINDKDMERKSEMKEEKDMRMNK